MTQCLTCFNNVAKHLPLIDPRQRLEVLIGATCFPCGDCEDVEKQLQDLAANTDGTLGGCIAHAEREVDRVMAELPVDTPSEK